MAYISKQMNIFAQLHKSPIKFGYILNAELIHFMFKCHILFSMV